MKRVDAESLLRMIGKWRCYLYPAWDVERKIEEYANGGPPPSEGDTCDEDVVPLGFAQTHMKKEMDPLLDALDLEPGIVQMDLVLPLIPDPERTLEITTHINEEVNNVLMTYYKPVLTNAAGRATVGGRASLYRLSPNDFKLKCGRMLHPPEAGVDTLDSDFREWAFDGKISLRTIDERLKTTEPGRIGWNREGLEALKKWILASQAEKYRTAPNSAVGGSYSVMDWADKFDWRVWADVDLAHCGYVRPVDVYWYFRKNGKITEDDDLYGGHEEVDLYCISRFGSQCDVRRTVRDNITYQSMDISYPEAERKAYDKMIEESRDEEELEKKDYRDRRLLFYVPSAFKSIRECLVFHNDDAAVSGDQLMGDVRGNGKVAMPKLAIMEGLLANLMEGLGFAAQVTWSVAPGTVICELRDTMPRKASIKNGGVIDLNPGAAKALGLKPPFKHWATWRWA